MSLVRVHNFSVSLDGFSAGADQSGEAPVGHAGQRLVRWFMGTRSFHVTQGQEGGSTGVDDAFSEMAGIPSTGMPTVAISNDRFTSTPAGRNAQKAVILGSSPSDQTGPGRYRVVLIAREENGQPAQGRAGVPSATAPLAKPEDVDEELQGRGRGWPRHRARRPSALKRLRSRS